MLIARPVLGIFELPARALVDVCHALACWAHLVQVDGSCARHAKTTTGLPALQGQVLCFGKLFFLRDGGVLDKAENGREDKVTPKLPKRCRRVACHVFPKDALVNPGELWSCRTNAQQVVEQLLLQQRFGPSSANIG